MFNWGLQFLLFKSRPLRKTAKSTGSFPKLQTVPTGYLSPSSRPVM